MADISIDAFCHPTSASSSRNGGGMVGDAQVCLESGVAWAQVGAYAQALDALRQAIRFVPDLADAYAAIGNVSMALGCWQEAIHSYQKALLAAPDHLESYYGLGSAYGRLGDYDQAIKAFEEGLQKRPIKRDQSLEAVAVSHDCLQIDATPLEPDTFQDRLRSESESFDFSALLATPEERRQEVRQKPEQDADTSPADVANKSIRAAAPPPAYFSEENVRIITPHLTPMPTSETPLSPLERARRKKVALVVGILVVIASISLEVYIITH